MIELSIIPECFVDTKTAEIVGQAAKKYNHQHGCGNVARVMKTNFKDRIALGIIDEDKNKGPEANYFSEFHVIKTENNLILKRHKDRKHYLILICPEMEQWLVSDAANVNLNVKEFDLPDNMEGFKELTKAQNIDKNIGFYRFIKRLLRDQAQSITTLKNWIELYKNDQLDTLINS